MYSNEEDLVQLLQESGLLAPEDVEFAQAVADGKSAVLALVSDERISEEDLTRTLANNAGMEFYNLAAQVPDQAALDSMDKTSASRYKVVPAKLAGSVLTIAVWDPFDIETLDALPHVFSGYKCEFVLAQRSTVFGMIKDFYGIDPNVAPGDAINIDMGAIESADDAPIIKLVSQVLQDAFSMSASDIHIEPMVDRLRIRLRIDGALHVVAEHPLRLHGPILARLKIMTGSMSIDEKRVPQDGRIQAKLGRKEIDLRVSTVPTNHGESVVMRILDKSSLLLGLAELGFFSDDEEMFNELIALPDGIILVTGPTGSGKTTTLYACLNTINRPDRKIITVEDPVEYMLPGINQVPVKASIGMTFAAALRSMLRQSPNIVMVGEIRDQETAAIAINASLTGHLVFSTLHTNDAPSSVARLADMGIKPFLIASATRAMIAQRLVKKVCPECNGPTEMSERELRLLSVDLSKFSDVNLRRGTGCKLCRQTGYKGRLGILETFRMTEEMKNLVTQELSTPALRRRARELGMRTLREDGIRKMVAGVTTAEEVIRVTGMDAD
ncbi:MAG: GspE/PulE family protein [Verrucomicrobia bacterium]|nr:GspE/PulE family protein [Verrucomicrobiota bacterium]